MPELLEAKKATHASVHYGRGMPASHCSICQHYIDRKKPRCEIVRSPIGPRMWCSKFERKG